MFKNKLGEDSPIPKFKHPKIRRRDGVKSLTILEEGEFKLPIDGCINVWIFASMCFFFFFFFFSAGMVEWIS